MKILGLSSKDSGCGYHRVLLPLGFMNGITGYVTNFLTEDKIEGWDAMLYNRMCPYQDKWQETRDLLKCKIIMDLDDYWVLPPSHINSQHYEKHAQVIENNIADADLVTVTNRALADRVRPFNSNVKILPNALPYGFNQFIEDRRVSDRVRIFWAGGATHEADLAMLRNPITRLKQHKDKIQMVLGGFTDTDLMSRVIWNRMFSAFTCGGTLPYMKIHGTKPNNYMQMYEHADIMLIPLEESEWHACKSNLKILEAASKRIPVIVSNVAPYNEDKDLPVLWVNSQKDWFEHLNFLINNPKERIELGNKLYEYCKEHYNIEQVNEERYRAFESICEVPTLS